MKARIERNWMDRTLKVWLWQPAPKGSRLVRITGVDQRESVDLDEGQAAPEPSLVLHEEEAEALLRELSGVLPPTDATVEHLQDARIVRDKLLAMIEKRGLK